MSAVLVTSAFALPTVTVLRKSPEFTIADASGKTTQLSSFKGKVVVMEFLFVKSPQAYLSAGLCAKGRRRQLPGPQRK
jgi:cytochrome oxidase Cu insertion factor (SCO1/SenC/PrrC family)